jgi:hypothetical protein
MWFLLDDGCDESSIVGRTNNMNSSSFCDRRQFESMTNTMENQLGILKYVAGPLYRCLPPNI